MEGFDLYQYNNVFEIIPLDDQADNMEYSHIANIIRDSKIDTILSRNISNILFHLPNIHNVIFQDISALENGDLGEIIFDMTWYGEEKVISYMGRPTSKDITIEGTINHNIVELNIPLNQNLIEIVNENPNIRSLGINGDSFNYWNTIPNINRIVVFVTPGVNVKMASYYLQYFRGDVLFVTW